MVYATAAQLNYLTGNPASYDDTTVEAIIAQGEREIDARVAPHGLTASGAAITAVSLELGKANYLDRARIDGTLASNMSIGDMTVGNDWTSTISAIRGNAYAMLDKWIEVSLTAAASRHEAYVYVVNR